MGAKQKYNEKTVMVSFRCPESKVDEFKKQAVVILNKWEHRKSFKVSNQDENLLVNRKYTVKKVRGKSHVCRTVENAKGKFNVLLAQDILGMNCEVMFVDSNTLNNERENIKPVNREVEFIY